jgi:hypothetical protein
MTGNRSNLPGACGAGHTAGIGAIHAGSAVGGRRRLEQLADFLPWPVLVADGIIQIDGSLYFGAVP